MELKGLYNTVNSKVADHAVVFQTLLCTKPSRNVFYRPKSLFIQTTQSHRVKPNNPSDIQKMSRLFPIIRWMLLNLHKNKTKKKRSCRSLAPGQQRAVWRSHIKLYVSKPLSQKSKVLFSTLALGYDQHIKSIIKTGFFHLKKIARGLPTLSTADEGTRLHVFQLGSITAMQYPHPPTTSTERWALLRQLDDITPLVYPLSIYFQSTHKWCLKVLLHTYKIIQS